LGHGLSSSSNERPWKSEGIPRKSLASIEAAGLRHGHAKSVKAAPLRRQTSERHWRTELGYVRFVIGKGPGLAMLAHFRPVSRLRECNRVLAFALAAPSVSGLARPRP